MRVKDIRGQQFGRLTVLRHIGYTKSREAIWLCQCDCGRYKEVPGTRLRSGRTTTCGYCRRDHSIDLKGQRFGRLVVLRRAEENAPNGNALWICQCDCGNRRVVDSYRLRKGHQQSCGCLRREKSRERMLHNQQLMSSGDEHLRTEDGVYYASLRLGRRNRTGHVGVSFDKETDKFVARLMFHGKYVLNKATRSFTEACALREQAELQYLHHYSKSRNKHHFFPN